MVTMNKSYFEYLYHKFLGKNVALLGMTRLRLWNFVFTLAFWCLLLFGIWQVASGFYEGPNYAATRIVTVDSVGTWTSEGRNGGGNTYWIVRYHYTPGGGESKSGKVTITDYSEATQQIRDATQGNEVLLRIPVDGNEPGARFGINTTVRSGLITMLLLLILGYFYRYKEPLVIDPNTGEVMRSKAFVIQLLLSLFGVMYGVLWLTSPVIPS